MLSFAYWSYAKLNESHIRQIVSEKTKKFGLSVDHIQIADYDPFRFEMKITMDLNLPESTEILESVFNNIESIDDESKNFLGQLTDKVLSKEAILHIEISSHEMKISSRQSYLTLNFENHLLLNISAPLVIKSTSGHYHYLIRDQKDTIDFSIEGLNQNLVAISQKSELSNTTILDKINIQDISKFSLSMVHDDSFSHAELHIDTNHIQIDSSDYSHLKTLGDLSIAGFIEIKKDSTNYATDFYQQLILQVLGLSDQSIPLTKGFIRFDAFILNTNVTDLVDLFQSNTSPTLPFDTIDASVEIELGDGDLSASWSFLASMNDHYASCWPNPQGHHDICIEKRLNTNLTEQSLHTIKGRGEIILSDRLSKMIDDNIQNYSLENDSLNILSFLSGIKSINFDLEMNGLSAGFQAFDALHMVLQTQDSTYKKNSFNLDVENANFIEDTFGRIIIDGQYHVHGFLADHLIKKGLLKVAENIGLDPSMLKSASKKLDEDYHFNELNLSVSFQATDFCLPKFDYNGELSFVLESDVMSSDVIFHKSREHNPNTEFDVSLKPDFIRALTLFAKEMNKSYKIDEEMEFIFLAPISIHYSFETDDMILRSGESILHLKDINRTNEASVFVCEATQISRFARLARFMTRFMEMDEQYYSQNDYDDMIELYIQRVFGSMEGRSGMIQLPLIEAVWATERKLVDAFSLGFEPQMVASSIEASLQSFL